jgi:hypothetical protein
MIKVSSNYDTPVSFPPQGQGIIHQLILADCTTQSCNFLQGDMNHALEGDPKFWDLGNFLV